MFKKLISMATANLLLAAGLGVVASAPAYAVNTDASLNLNSTIKGAVITSVGNPNRLMNQTVVGSICLTSAQAADTSGSYATVLTPTASDAFVPSSTLRKYPSSSSFTSANFSSSSSFTNSTALSAGNVIAFVVDAGPAPFGTTFLWYGLVVTIDNCGSTPAPSTPTPTLSASEISAAAAAAVKAAAEAAAAIRAAEVAVAQTKLSTVLKGDKAGTIDEYKSANINVTTAESLARINAEVLKLSANDRSDFAKIKVIADKIEFDESFFNATARPTLTTYAKYEVVGITERTLSTINAKVLELPAAKRIDAAAIQEIVKIESFVDVVANPATRTAVTSTRLIEKGLLPAETPYKHSVRSALASYPEGSLNSLAKIEAAIKAELEKAGARKAKTAEIKARIAARNK